MSWQNLTQEQLELLPTPRLLNIFKMIRRQSGCWDCRNNFEPDCDCHLSKSKAAEIKQILDARDHVGESDKVNHKTRDRKLDPPVARDRHWDLYAGNYSSNKHPERVGPIKDPESAVGQQVFKTSGKPFKSKEKYNTVSSVTTNPHTGRVAFAFEEDESVVDAHQCELRK